MSLPGFQHLPGYLGQDAQRQLLDAIRAIVAEAPFYRPTMLQTGRPFSVEMTNCGPLGWVSDRHGGYRYQPAHPVTGNPWPAFPNLLTQIWQDVAGGAPAPEACLINWYAPGAKLGLHRDSDEEDRSAPVVSISLGDDCWFRIGGVRRRDPTERFLLKSGDVVVLGGPSREAYHGVDRILPGTSELLNEPGRINLTLRRVRA